MDSSRLTGSKNAVQTMLYYYMFALVEEGVGDPKSYIANEIADMLSLAEEQFAYACMAFDDGPKAVTNLERCVQLLDGMLKTGKMDAESIKIVSEILKITLENVKSITEDIARVVEELEEDDADETNG